MRIGALLSVIVAVAAIVLLGVWQALDSQDHPRLLLEAGKAAIQLIGIGVIGGALAQLWKAREEDRAAAREGEDKRALLVRELRAAYFAAKAARRALQSVGFADSSQTRSSSFWDQERLGIYRQQMAELNRAQLLLEGLAVEVGLWPEAFSEPTVLGQHIATLENGMRKVSKEYERSGLALSSSASQYAGHLDVLVAFLAYAGPGGFGATVVDPYRGALRAAKPELKPASAFRKQAAMLGGTKG